MDPVGDTTLNDAAGDAAGDAVSDAAASRRRSLVLIGVAAAALTTVFFVLQSRAPRPANDLSVAVLPLENHGAAPDDAYLAAGMQDEIVSLLGRVGALRVVSRNTTQRYAGTRESPPQIGAELGVTYLLTGSVQRVGAALHVDMTLLGAADQRPVWTTSYQRNVSDAFAIESEVAQAVTEALRARRLTSGERMALTNPPTANAAAYDAYLRARALGERTARDEADIRRAIAAYQEAVRLDPKFAAAWSQLSRRQSSYYSMAYDRSEARRDAARQALETAERLAPNSVETKAARAYFLFVVKEDLEGAERAVLELEKLYPSSPDIATGLAQITRELGRLDRSTGYARRAIASDPLNPYRQYQLCQDYLTSREIVLATQTCDGALALLPGDVGILALEATIHQSRGELTPARNQLSGLTPNAGDWRTLRVMSRQFLLDREPARAVALLGKYLATPDNLGTRRGVVRRWMADAQRQAGDAAGARASYEAARGELTEELSRQPANPLFLGELAIVQARLGDGAAANGLAQRCEQLARASRRTGYVADCELARIQVALASGGAAELPGLLDTALLQRGALPPLTVNLLRLDPDFDDYRPLVRSLTPD
jgi:TolB-like protein